ncbi:MAG TPA: ANTAR domain-containing protein [Microbacteriaceae bacterium]
MADVATIGILHERAIRERTLVTEQLQIALDSRVVIEQAKGVVAQTSGVPMDEAFARLRDYARRHNQRLHEVAENVISRALNI